MIVVDVLGCIVHKFLIKRIHGIETKKIRNVLTRQLRLLEFVKYIVFFFRMILINFKAQIADLYL